MTAKPNPLRVVPITPSPEASLRQLLPELDQAEAEVARIKAAIAEQGRLFVRAKGEFMAPTVERLKRELFGG